MTCQIGRRAGMTGAISMLLLVLFSLLKDRDPAQRSLASAVEAVHKFQTQEGNGCTDTSCSWAGLQSIPLIVSNMIVPTTVMGRQAITVVFNRAVLSLGANFGSETSNGVAGVRVHGQDPLLWRCGTAKVSSPVPPVQMLARWVTTSIVRYDTVRDWPTDLVCDVQVNPQLHAFDGRLVESPPSAHFVTPALTMQIDSVTSVKLMQLTDNLWASKVGDGYPDECPDDAVVTLRFNTLVDPILVLQKLVIVDPKRSVKLAPNAGCTDCNTVQIQLPSLTVGKQYAIQLLIGAKVSKEAGATQKLLSVPVMGLHRFTIPWDNRPYSNLAHTTQRIWCRHGCPTNLALLKGALSITPALEGGFTLKRVSAAVVALIGAFKPGKSYYFVVKGSANVRDGCGLQLQSNTLTKATDALIQFLEGPAPFVLQKELSGSPLIKLLGRGLAQKPVTTNPYQYCQGQQKKAVPIQTHQVLDALNALTDCLNSKLFKHPFITVGPTPADLVVHEFTMNGGSLLGTTGLYLLQTLYSIAAPWEPGCHSSTSASCELYMETSIGVTATVDYDVLTVWVTNLDDAAGLQGASVRLYRQPQRYYGPQPYQLVSSATTDQNGFAEFPVVEGLSGSVQVVVEQSGRLAVTALYVPWSQGTMQMTADLLLDRKLYRAGEEVHLKGYLQVYDVDTSKVPLSKYPNDVTLTVFWGDSSVKYPIKVNTDFGSFDYTLKIPEDVTYGSKSMSVSEDSIIGGFSWTSFTVADPRVPSGHLTFTTDALVYRPSDGCITVHITTETYLGTLAKASHVDLEWALGDATGVMEVDLPNGDIDYQFCLSSQILTTAAAKRQQLVITAKWFTATRDLLTEQVSVLVAISKLSIALSVVQNDNEAIVPGLLYDRQLTITISGPTQFSATNPPPVKFCSPVLTDSTVDIYQSSLCTTDPQSWSSETQSPSVTILTAIAPVTLPDMGHYRLTVRVVDEAGVAQLTGVTVGRTATEWRFRPLLDLLQINAMQVGEHDDVTTSVSWNCPFTTAKALLVWGSSRTSVPYKRIVQVHSGSNTFVIPREVGCTEQCQLKVLVVTGKLTELHVSVPTSQLLDSKLPKLLTLGPLTLPSIPHDVPLPVGVSAPKEALPGDTVEISLTLPAGLGELAVWVVDKALLDLIPDDRPTTFNCELPPYKYLRNSEASLYNDLASYWALQKAFNLTKERVTRDPWLRPYAWRLTPGNGLDQDTSTALECQYNVLTYFPPARWGLKGSSDDLCAYSGPIHGFEKGDIVTMDAVTSGPAVPAPAPSTEVSPSAPTGDTSGSVQAIPSSLVRKNFMATALFEGSVQTDEKTGEASVQLKIPDNLGTWLIRVAAVYVAPDGIERQFGTAEAELTVRRPVSLTASAPRIVRIRDEFSAGCSITSATAGVVIVRLEFDGATSLQFRDVPTSTSAEKSINVEADTPTEVTFALQCVAVGSTALKFSAWRQTDTDSFLYQLPSLGIQPEVVVATSFAIMATAATEPDPTATQSLTCPAAEPGSGSVSIEAGVGRWPAVQSLGQQIATVVSMVQTTGNDVFATDLLSLALVPSMYRKYSGSALTALKDAQRLATDALNQLVDYCTEYGLLELPVRRMTYPWVSFETNVYGVFMWYRKDPDVHSRLTEQWVQYWKEALWNELRLEWNHGYPSWGRLAEVYFAYTYANRPSETDSDMEQFSFQKLVDNYLLLGDEQKAMLAITICESKDRSLYEEVVNAITDDFSQRIRTQERTAYIGLPDGSPHATSMATNALALYALLISGRYQIAPLLEHLANYVAQGQSPTFPLWSYYWFSSQVAIYRMDALALLDSMSGSTAPSLTFTVTEAHTSQTLVQKTFNDVATPPLSYTTAYSTFNGTQHPELQFQAVGVGDLFTTLTLRFVPAETFTGSVYYGLYIEKVIKVIQQDGSMVLYTPGMILIPGQAVQVVLQVTTVDDLPSTVKVVDWQSGGLEAVDPNVSPIQLMPPGTWDPITLFGDFPDRWSFPFMEVRSDAVTFMSPSLSAGSHMCSYRAVVVSSGTFQVPPAHGYLCKQPELMGLSNTFVITVEEL